jgi:hypothetical protein
MISRAESSHNRVTNKRGAKREVYFNKPYQGDPQDSSIWPPQKAPRTGTGNLHDIDWAVQECGSTREPGIEIRMPRRQLQIPVAYPVGPIPR